MKDAVMIANEVNINVDTPETFKQAMKSKHATEWKIACDEELPSVKNLEVYKLEDTPQVRITIYKKWVFKIKVDEFRNVAQFKEYMKKHGVDYELTYIPVSRMPRQLS